MGADEANQEEAAEEAAHEVDVTEAAREAAMYDTLRVLAGGYFGQDSQLAPIVSDYLRRSAQT
jgi:hypothetical protein